MARAKNTLLSVAVVGLVLLFLFKQTVKIDVGSPSVSFLQLSGNGLRLNVKLPILNRSDFSYPIEGFLGLLVYGSTALGNVTLKQPLVIPARSHAEPEFTALIDWGALGTEAYGLLKSAGVVDWLLSKIGLGDPASIKPVSWNAFSIRGTLYVGGIAVDINQKIA